MRTAVVGHVEWVTFARVGHVPRSGQIVHADDVLDVVAGGGPVAAVQLAKLAGACTFFTALGDDALGHRAKKDLEAMGVRVESVFRAEPQRRAFVHVDDRGERTITVLGPRLGPHADDPLPWDELDGADAVYFCAGDDDALRIARRARVLVATTRELDRLVRVGVQLDAAVGSARDDAEQFEAADLNPPAGVAAWTEGAAGGRYVTADGRSGRWEPATVGDIVDTYGAGDSFVAGLTFALARGLGANEALAVGARCGAACLQGRGPYEGQLAASDL